MIKRLAKVIVIICVLSFVFGIIIAMLGDLMLLLSTMFSLSPLVSFGVVSVIFVLIISIAIIGVGELVS